MSLTCHLCGLELCREGEGYIALIGESMDEKLARWMDAAGRHMAAVHPEVMTEMLEASSMLGYLVLAENFRTDEPSIEDKTRQALNRTLAVVKRVQLELIADHERALKGFD